jgi:hypothetical protein
MWIFEGRGELFHALFIDRLARGKSVKYVRALK